MQLDSFLRLNGQGPQLSYVYVPPLAVPVIPLIGTGAWYDRNPISSIFEFVGSLAPHAKTYWWAYTVPKNKKAFAEAIMCRVNRATVAAPAVQAECGIEVQLLNNAALTGFLRLNLFGNTIDDHDTIIVGNSVMLQAGEKITGYTFDISTGGSVDYNLTCKITEFDA